MAERKKAVNGKKKGSGFEGAMAKLLTEKLAPLKFRRSQQSGAIVGGKNEHVLQQFGEDMKVLFVGDVVPSNESDLDVKFRFSVETKFYKTPEHLEHLLGQNNCIIMKWFEESVDDARKLNRLPILLFRFNHTSNYMCVDSAVELPNTCVNVLIVKTPARTVKIALLDDALKTPSWFLIDKKTGQCKLYSDVAPQLIRDNTDDRELGEAPGRDPS
jgi:hypothetical protein